MAFVPRLKKVLSVVKNILHSSWRVVAQISTSKTSYYHFTGKNEMLNNIEFRLYCWQRVVSCSLGSNEFSSAIFHELKREVWTRRDWSLPLPCLVPIPFGLTCLANSKIKNKLPPFRFPNEFNNEHLTSFQQPCHNNTKLFCFIYYCNR